MITAIRVAKTVALVLALGAIASAQLNQNCTVSVLNRNVLVNPDGSWVLPNIPANFGKVKARATCVQNGVTISGESDYFVVNANTAVNLPAIVLGSASQIPVALAVNPNAPSFTAIGQTTQLTVTATYPDNSTKNVTASSTGTGYTTSNAAIATVSPEGLVTAVNTGTVVIQATNDGAAAIISVRTVVGGATVGGVPVAWATQYGLNPNDPTMPFQDPDRDGLTNLLEFQAGTDPTKADTDSDGLLDGDEVNKYQTSALLADTDGDLIPDGVEVQNGTNPNSVASYDLRKATRTSTLNPPTFTLSTSSVNQVASVQLSWKVLLIDGKTTLDLTADARTTYSSSDIVICNFNSQKGLVFAGTTGSCTITATNNTLTATSTGTVSGFTPTEISTLGVPGSVAVDVAGNFAYVATGSNGLAIVDVTDRTAPRIRSTLAGLGDAQGVRGSGQYVYLADAGGFLRVVRVANPDAPVLVASLVIAGKPNSLAVHGNLAAVAARTGGVSFVNLADPTAPILLTAFATGGSALGVDFDEQRGLSAIALGTGGVQIVDISNPSVPVARGTLPGGDVRRVLLRHPSVLLADASRSVTAVDITNPAQPVIATSLRADLGGSPVDIAAFGSIVMTADVSFGRAVPIIGIADPLRPSTITFWNLGGAGFSSSIAVDIAHGYLIVPGTLRILKYQNISDGFGVPPTVRITSPVSGTPLIHGQTLNFSVDATDDVAVASVNFLVNGLTVFSTSSPPYQFNYTVPTVSALTFSATATDYGNNVGAALNVQVQVIPDPLTTVKGRVIDPNGAPVSGAAVSSLGISVTTIADGTFTLSGLPTIKGPIVVTAVATLNGVLLGGVSAPAEPVRGGILTVGDIRIGPRPFITSVGPTAILAGTTATLSVAGANLGGSTFAFVPTTGITVNAATINPAGTSASITLAVSATAKGRFTLVGTNPAGASAAIAVVGFVRGVSAFNTISVPGPDGNADVDSDGLTNAQEITAGTDPLNGDTDGDNAVDGLEVSLGSDPRSASSLPNPNATHYVSGQIFSVLNNANPSAGLPGSKQYVSSLTFSILNSLNPAIGTPGSKQFISSLTFSLLNSLDPSTGVPGAKQYVSGQTFSMLNALNPAIGTPGSKQFISSLTFSMLNGLNPSTGVPGAKQYVSGQTFSILNFVRPGPLTFSVRFVNGLVFSIANTSAGPVSPLSPINNLATRVAHPGVFQHGLRDADGDGVSDDDEVLAGTNPFDRDTDRDGFPDGLEIALGSDPLDRNSIPNLTIHPGQVVSPMISIQTRSLQARGTTPPTPRRLQ